jgi:hypothetical protein
MGRVKIPRCDNCGAPVEFATGALETRCQYCGELLIRELAAPPPAPPVQQRYAAPSPVYRTPRTKVWPLLAVTGATVAIAGASGIASFATNFTPLPEPAAELRTTLAAVPTVQIRSESVSVRSSETRIEVSEPSKSSDAGRTRTPRATRPKGASAVVTAAPVEPPKLPPFDTQAAIAGLDAAKLKAEAACQSASITSLFVQMGFDADGRNRGAALSNPKLTSTPEAKCVLRIFRLVRIPAFDPKTKPGGLGRMVRL